MPSHISTGHMLLYISAYLYRNILHSIVAHLVNNDHQQYSLPWKADTSPHLSNRTITNHVINILHT